MGVSFLGFLNLENTRYIVGAVNIPRDTFFFLAIEPNTCLRLSILLYCSPFPRPGLCSHSAAIKRALVTCLRHSPHPDSPQPSSPMFFVSPAHQQVLILISFSRLHGSNMVDYIWAPISSEDIEYKRGKNKYTPVCVIGSELWLDKKKRKKLYSFLKENRRLSNRYTKKKKLNKLIQGNDLVKQENST